MRAVATAPGSAWEVVMAYGSRIFIAEAFLQPSQIVWRVATGPGYATAGGQPRRDSGVLALLGWDRPEDAITPETGRGIQRTVRALGRMEAELLRVRPLPLG